MLNVLRVISSVIKAQLFSAYIFCVTTVPLQSGNKPTLKLCFPDKGPQLADKQTAEENTFIRTNTGAHIDVHTHSKPYQPLQKGGIPEAQPGAEASSSQQEHSAGECKDSWQDDVDVTKKQAAVSVLHQQVDSTQTDHQPHHLVKIVHNRLSEWFMSVLVRTDQD